jgi:predicted phosphodiesterase
MKRYSNNKILVYGDLHAPYQDERALDFLADQKRRFKPDRVICVGDICDFYSGSRYPKDPDHPDSFVNELKKLQKVVTRLGKIFPEQVLTLGNHDDRLALRVSSAGVPSSMMLDFGNIVGAPKGWNIIKSSKNFTLTVDSTREHITFAHHRGINTALISQRLGMTYVAGHSHTKGQVVACNNGLKVIYGVNNPCLISNTGSPFSYNKLSDINPVRGCTLIENGVPRLVEF